MKKKVYILVVVIAAWFNIAWSQTKVNLPHFSDLVKELSPAVVNISSESSSDEDDDKDSPEDQLEPPNPFLKRDPGVPSTSLGSGFIISEDGLIVTNNHVVSEGKKIIVRLLDDKHEYQAKLVGQDLMTDLALIKIEPKAKLKTVRLGDSDVIEVGEWVLAIGNQFQLGQTVTAGIISAKSRRVNSNPGRPYDQFIQTDAPINPGSSGGPLFSTSGEVIGINTAIFSPGRVPQLGGTGFNIGIGFSIPINLAKSVISQLRSQGKVTRGLLGVLIQEIDDDMAGALGLDSPEGALVSEVKKDSPAERAGFKRGDIIVSYNAHPIKNHDDLPLMVANTKIGSEVVVEALRGGKKITLKPMVGELREPTPHPKEEGKPKANKMGLVIKDPTEEQIKQFDLQPGLGVLVDFVESNSAADKAKIVRGDVIEELAGQEIKNVAAFDKVLSGLEHGKPILALLRRRAGSFYVVIKLDAAGKS